MSRVYRCAARTVLAGVLVAGLIAGCGDKVIRPDGALVQEVRDQPYSDRDWAITLRDHVRYGLVDYDTLRAVPDPLLRYCALISITGPERTPDEFPGRSHATAYYVNAYNALVLRTVLSQPPDLPTMYDLSLPRLEYEYQFALDGQVVRLIDVQRKMLDASEGDVRTLLATSRAARGTPRLMAEPLRPETLDRQLAAAAADALDLPEILVIDHASRSVQAWQEILRHQRDFVEWWKRQRRVPTAYLFNVLLELTSPQQRRSLQNAVGYGFREVAFDRSLNRWERRADRSPVP